MSYTNGLDKPTDYFNTVLYTGDNTSNRSITGVGFQPSFVWNKNRSASANHNLWNEVTGITERLTSSGTQASEDYSSEFLSFDSDGVTITQNVASLDINNSSYNYVLWNWLAGGTASSNTDGSITSSVSANTTAGFSIVSFTGTGSNATVGHGIGTAPSMVIIKRRDSANDWRVGSDALTNWTKHINLNTTAAESDLAVAFNSTAPTSSVFSVGTSPSTNASGGTFIAYCFASIKGYSKIGSYTGNGNNDGTFIYTGFKPAFFMVKQTNTTRNWNLSDNKRTNSFNVVDGNVHPNLSNAENTYDILDFVSNGVKIRNSFNDYNQSGGTYIYMCFAESPFTTSTGIPTTAR